MILVVLKCVVVLQLVVAIPVSNEDIIKSIAETLRINSPSYVKNEDRISDNMYAGQSVNNVPEHTRPPHPPISNQPNTKTAIPKTERNLNSFLDEKETKYLQNGYQIPSNIFSQYQNVGEHNIQTPAVQWQEYQGSSALQKLLSNINLIKNILAPKPQTKPFILVYPNGTIGYEDDLSTVSNRYPNHMILSSSELRKLSNVERETQNVSAQSQHQQNIPNIVSSSTINTLANNIDSNQVNEIEKTYTQSNVASNQIDSQTNDETTVNVKVIEQVNNNSSIVTPNMMYNNVTAPKILQLKNTGSEVHNVANMTTVAVVDSVSDSNSQTVRGNNTQYLSIERNINTINITQDDLSNVSTGYAQNTTTNTTLNTNIQEQNSQNTNKLGEAIDEDNTRYNNNIQTTVNPNMEQDSNVMLKNSSSVVDSINTTKEFDYGAATTTVIPADNINDSNDDIRNMTTVNKTYYSPETLNDANIYETSNVITTTIGLNNTKSEDIITKEDFVNDNNFTENVTTSDCQCSEEEVVKDEDSTSNEKNIKLEGTDTVSWVQLCKEQAQNLLFGDDKDSPNIFFIFYNPPEMNVERETKTTTYPNGTVVEEYIEIRKIDGTTIRTSTSKTYNSLAANNTSDNR